MQLGRSFITATLPLSNEFILHILIILLKYGIIVGIILPLVGGFSL